MGGGSRDEEGQYDCLSFCFAEELAIASCYKGKLIYFFYSLYKYMWLNTARHYVIQNTTTLNT